MTDPLLDDIKRALNGEADAEQGGDDEEPRPLRRDEFGQSSLHELNTSIHGHGPNSGREVDVEAINADAEAVEAEMLNDLDRTPPAEQEPATDGSILQRSAELTGGPQTQDWRDEIRLEEMRKQETLRAQARAEAEAAQDQGYYEPEPEYEPVEVPEAEEPPDENTWGPPAGNSNFTPAEANQQAELRLQSYETEDD
jgi:hypothetical protein